MARTLKLEAEIEVKHDTEVEYPVIEIEYSYIRGRPAFTPRGEYGPIDPPDPAEVDFRSAKLIDGKGMKIGQEEVDFWARDYLDSDLGYTHALATADSQKC